MSVSVRQALNFSATPKISLKLEKNLTSRKALSLAYTPGIAHVSQYLVTHPEALNTHTFVRNNLAVISDGSSVLGLGNVGHKAAYPVMEGKAMLFKRFAGIDAIPLIIKTQDTDTFITVVANLADSFAAINLEDIAAPNCFEIETKLKSLVSIPLMHDDQHGTAIVVLAALTNALTLLPKNGHQTRIVINGAGAAGVAITKMLLASGFVNLTVVDSQGIIHLKRPNLDKIKTELAKITNSKHSSGPLEKALQHADVFIGVSRANILNEDDLKLMNEKPIIFALANPTPEIMPELALKAGAGLVATGRSDFPNQINNALAFPGVFRGAIDARSSITESMKLVASQAINSYHHQSLSLNNLIPSILDPKIHHFIASEVFKAASKSA